LSPMTTYNAHIPVDRCYPLIRTGLEELAGDELLEGQYYAILAPYANRCAAVLDRLHCVLDLIV
jgi:hypothetical protein